MNNDMSAKIAAVVQRLAGRLSKLGLLDLDDNPDEEIGIAFVSDLDTGATVPAINLGEQLYSEQGGELIVQREAEGRIKWARVGDDGLPGEWQDAPAPSSRSALN